MKRNNRYKHTHNQFLDLLRELPRGADLPTENRLSESLDASRTTIRAVLAHLADIGLIEWQGRHKKLLRKPLKRDYFQVEETRSTQQRIESHFMQSILGGDIDEGALLNESEMARQLDVSTSAVREYLIRFSRFGLIRKAPDRGWVLNGFTRAFALELSDMRELFEPRSVALFIRLPASHPAWQSLAALEQEHVRLLPRMQRDYLQFAHLDDRFHQLINGVADNRFIDDFHDLIKIIFHYHYRWNKKDEVERNTAAAQQHLAIIAALQAGDEPAALSACNAHLAQARQTLLRSLVGDRQR